MDAGLAVGGGLRSSFRKPSHDTSRRNYRRRSPSSARSSSSSPSPAPGPGPSGGWKRDRSASPSSPRRDGATRSSLLSKKGKTAHEGRDDSDEDSQGRRGERGRGAYDRQARGSSFDRYGKPDLYSSRRSGGSHYDRNSQPYGRHTSRDTYGDSRRNGDHDPSSRHRQSSDRGYTDGSRSRDKDITTSRDRGRDSEGIVKGRAHGRETNSDKDLAMQGTDRDRARDRDRDRARDRDRDRARSRSRERERVRGSRSARDVYSARDSDVERRYDGSRSRERDRERVRGRHTPGDLSTDYCDGGEIDRDRSGEKDRERDRGRGKQKDKQQNKSGARIVSSPRCVDKENVWSEDKVKESQKDRFKEKTKLHNSDRDMELQRDTGDRTREGAKDRDRELVEDKEGVRDLSSVDSKEKDVVKIRDTSRVRDGDLHRNRDDVKEQGLPRDHDRQGDGGDVDKGGDLKGKDESKVTVRVKDRDEYRERSRHGDKEDHRVRVREKQDVGTGHEHHRTTHRQGNERSGNRMSCTSEEGPHWDNDKETGSERHTYEVAQGKERTLSSTIVSDQAVKSEKEKHQSTRVKEDDRSGRVVSRDGLGSKDADCINHDLESTPRASILVPITSDSDKSSATLDGKAMKMPSTSKWGPEAADSTATASASEELTNDLSAAKLAAMKAAELVNKNLGVAGFMSADQKKRLLWGSKKLAVEQEPAVTAGSNRWDTVHFSDPDRQEKFHKLMGVKADASTELKKEGETDPGTFTEERQRELQQDLEKQFTAGLRRRDGGKVGLGL